MKPRIHKTNSLNDNSGTKSRLTKCRKALNFLTIIRRSRFQSILFLTIAAGIFNLGFQILLARKLTISDFGYFSAVWSGIGVVGLFTIGFQNQAIIATKMLDKSQNVPIRAQSYLSSITLATSLLALFAFILMSMPSDRSRILRHCGG
jgi:O-antigen/teichoic acid export membrane protein